MKNNLLLLFTLALLNSGAQTLYDPQILYDAPGGVMDHFAKLQGIRTLKSGMINLYQNKLPVYELLSGASIAIGALLLMLPGFFTDFLGFKPDSDEWKVMALSSYAKKHNVYDKKIKNLFTPKQKLSIIILSRTKVHSTVGWTESYVY